MKNELDIIWLQSVDSTNNEVKRRLSVMDNLTVIAADDQTAGRGQRGNRWIVEPGANMTFSLLLRFGAGELPSLPARDQFLISEAATLVVRRYLSSRGIDTLVKWPNDIYAGDRKICGMLIENTLSSAGGVADSIVGIGLNVMQKEFPPMLQNPVSMTLLTGKDYDVHGELDALGAFLYDWLAVRLSSGSGRQEIASEYGSCLYRKGEVREFNDNILGERFMARITGVTPEGKLMVETVSGEKKEYSFKEISYVI